MELTMKESRARDMLRALTQSEMDVVPCHRERWWGSLYHRWKAVSEIGQPLAVHEQCERCHDRRFVVQPQTTRGFITVPYPPNEPWLRGEAWDAQPYPPTPPPPKGPSGTMNTPESFQEDEEDRRIRAFATAARALLDYQRMDGRCIPPSVTYHVDNSIVYGAVSNP